MQSVDKPDIYGTLSIENIPDELISEVKASTRRGRKPSTIFNCHIGIKVTEEGKVWLCINGIAFIRFNPRPSSK
jgi:hypothetical protein